MWFIIGLFSGCLWAVGMLLPERPNWKQRALIRLPFVGPSLVVGLVLWFDGPSGQRSPLADGFWTSSPLVVAAIVFSFFRERRWRRS